MAKQRVTLEVEYDETLPGVNPPMLWRWHEAIARAPSLRKVKVVHFERVVKGGLAEYCERCGEEAEVLIATPYDMEFDIYVCRSCKDEEG